MLSTRPIYHGDHDVYRRSERGLQMASGQIPSLSEQRSSSTASSRRQSPNIENDSKSVVSQRKRVPVACERCRKRKIKCSGDEGGGQGCLNCRNAGYTGCQFLRVQSFNAPVNDAALLGNKTWQPPRYHPYSHHVQRSVVQGQNQTIYHPSLSSYPTWTTNVDYGSYPGGWARSSYPTQYALAYDHEVTDSYSTPAPPSYMLPDPETHHLNMAHVNALNRPQHSPVWSDQMNSLSMTYNNGNLPNSYSASLAEPQPSYPALSVSVGSSSISDRLLSTASNVRCLPSVSMAANNTSPLSTVSHRSSLGWQNELGSHPVAPSLHTLYEVRPDATASHINVDNSPPGLSCASATTSNGSRTTTPTAAIAGTPNEPHFRISSRTMENSPRSNPPSKHDACGNEILPLVHTSTYKTSYDPLCLQDSRRVPSTNLSYTPNEPACVWNPSTRHRALIQDLCQQDITDSHADSHHGQRDQYLDLRY